MEDLVDNVDLQGFFWNQSVVSRDEYRNDRNSSIQSYQEATNPRLEFCQSLHSVETSIIY